MHILLKREGRQLGRSQAYRLYSEEQLQLRSKLPKRRKMVVQRRQRIEPRKAGDAWTMDFVADEFGRGGKFRVLTVVDVFIRQALAREAGLRLKGENVVEVLNRLVARAIEYCGRATRLSPTYANAWADLFLAYVGQAESGKVTLPTLGRVFARFKPTAKGHALLERAMPEYEALLGKWETRLK